MVSGKKSAAEITIAKIAEKIKQAESGRVSRKHDLKPAAAVDKKFGLNLKTAEMDETWDLDQAAPVKPSLKERQRQEAAELHAQVLDLMDKVDAKSSAVNPKTFRPLNDRELNKLSIEFARFKPSGKRNLPVDHPLLLDSYGAHSARVSYETMQGGFTVCVIVLTHNIAGPHTDRFKKHNPDVFETLLWRGASRRSYRDRHNQIKAEMLAFERAILCSRAERLPV